MSLQLFHFLSRHIVGPEEVVKTRRLMCTISDNLKYESEYTIITSGSTAEGLEMDGSDWDIMIVLNKIIVHENTDNIKPDRNKCDLIMEMHDTKPGYTQLRAVDVPVGMEKLFEQRGNSWYLSSELFKLCCLQQLNNKTLLPSKIHGPCISDVEESRDHALCFHNPHWIQAAENWISKGLTSWPSSDVKSDIINHGVLLVPIGCKGSVNETLEWRISFSVAEKLLIYSFSHTQLLCYALMKILLKDVINSNINCKNLLCSYFIKTIIFWVSEETPVTEWRPENLVQCFMSCFRRLLYCVEYSMCPHYFIPINNMFENKIEKQSRKILLEHLNTLFSFGWRCVLFSEQLKNFTIYSNALPSTSEIRIAKLRLFRQCYNFYNAHRLYPIKSESYRRCIRIFNVYKSSVIKLTHLIFMSESCSTIKQSTATPSDINKKMYSQRREQLAYLLQSIHYDAVCGWIHLAAFFYKTKQYSNALYIMSYAMTKCTPEKVYRLRDVISQIQINFITSTTLQKLGKLRVLKLVALFTLIFSPKSAFLLPQELALDFMGGMIVHPVAFAHFLCFLCHYHLNDVQHCYTSIRDLQLIIDEKYFITDSLDTEQSYYLLGVALQLVRRTYLAKRAFTNAIQCSPHHTRIKSAAVKRLSMMHAFEKE